MNLCVNARDAMPDGGEIAISVAECDLGAKEAEARFLARGPYVRIQVADTGTGIPPGIAERIWEPFFTTKGHGKGTGLGFSTVRGIVENHRGFISAAPNAPHGTVFEVLLPAEALPTHELPNS